MNPLQFVRLETLAHRSHDAGQAVAAHGGPPAIMEEAADMPSMSLAPLPAQRSLTSRHPPNSQQLRDQRVAEIQVILEGQFSEAESAEELLAGARDRVRADMRFS